MLDLLNERIHFKVEIFYLFRKTNLNIPKMHMFWILFLAVYNKTSKKLHYYKKVAHTFYLPKRQIPFYWKFYAPYK